ncbi:MAG: hypothetical protein AABX73_02935 [Nanoarchaeota archaeon]
MARPFGQRLHAGYTMLSAGDDSFAQPHTRSSELPEGTHSEITPPLYPLEEITGQEVFGFSSIKAYAERAHTHSSRILNPGAVVNYMLSEDRKGERGGLTH